MLKNKKTYFVCLLLFCAIGVQKLHAQNIKELLPLDIVQQYFSPNGFADKSAYICCEASKCLNFSYTLGELLPKNSQTNCELLSIDSTNSVVAVEIIYPLHNEDIYVFLNKFDGTWKMASMRTILQLDSVRVMLDRLKTSTPDEWKDFYDQEKRTTFEFDYHNTKLWVAPDKVIMRHFEKNKNNFEKALQIIEKKGYLDTKILQIDKSLTTLLDELYLRNLYFDTEQCTNCLLFEIGSINQNGVGYFYLDPKYKTPAMSDTYFIVIKPLGNGWYFYKTT